MNKPTGSNKIQQASMPSTHYFESVGLKSCGTTSTEPEASIKLDFCTRHAPKFSATTGLIFAIYLIYLFFLLPQILGGFQQLWSWANSQLKATKAQGKQQTAHSSRACTGRHSLPWRHRCRAQANKPPRPPYSKSHNITLSRPYKATCSA